ncbi:hypothetical protein PA08_2643 [Cutibacterium modestum P08]|nr:hypothetical protein PA08_2643 [Cutibacterium modestum P08]
MGEPKMADPFVGRPHPVPHIDGNSGGGGVGVDDHAHPVIEGCAV